MGKVVKTGNPLVDNWNQQKNVLDTKRFRRQWEGGSLSVPQKTPDRVSLTVQNRILSLGQITQRLMQGNTYGIHVVPMHFETDVEGDIPESVYIDPSDPLTSLQELSNRANEIQEGIKLQNSQKKDETPAPEA